MFSILLSNNNTLFIYLFILFYFICHTIITKTKGKESKKEVARRPNRNYGAYDSRLGLLDLQLESYVFVALFRNR